MVVENESLLDENFETRPLKDSSKSNQERDTIRQSVYDSNNNGCNETPKGRDQNGSTGSKTWYGYYLHTFWKCMTNDPIYKRLIKKRADIKGINSVSKCDKVSRIIFPVSFLFLNIIYWNTYYKTK